MNKKLKGFSLAELLISLLIISIVLSAAIPTLTKRSSGSVQIWRWANSNNSAYFGMGALQSAILGNDMIPDVNITNTFEDIEGLEDISINNIKYTNSGDKLVILKQSPGENANSHLMNSHISFFTLANTTDATVNDIVYAGRLSMERHNIALGIGALQSMLDTSSTDSGFFGKNTALGHYTLLSNQGGSYNTAVGENALSNSKFASHNTALGFQAGLYLDKYSNVDSDNKAARNTAVGSQALKTSTYGQSNTTIGFSSLYSLTNGLGNTVIGANSCSQITEGSNNICIGLNAGNLYGDTADSSFVMPDFAVNEGLSQTSDNILYIGSMPDGTFDGGKISSVPLIFGRMQHDVDNNRTRKIAFNTSQFAINTFNGALPMLGITTYAGSDGASEGSDYTGKFSLRTYRDSSGNDTFFALSGDSNIISLLSNDTGNNTSTNYKNIHINEGLLDLDFNDATSGSGGHDLVINSDADNVYLFDNRFIFENSTKFPRITFDSNGNIKLQNSANNAYISVNDDASINLFSSNLNVTDTQAEVKVPFKSSENANFNKNVKISNLAATSAGTDDVVQAFVNVYQKISQLEARINAMYSDERLKNILSDNTAGLKEINALEVKNYTYKDDKNNTPHVGVIAQQLQKVFPNSVTADEKGFLMIKTEEIFYAMVNSIKELYASILDLTAKITGLDKRITELEKENADLKLQNAEFELRLQKLEEKLK